MRAPLAVASFFRLTNSRVVLQAIGAAMLPAAPKPDFGIYESNMLSRANL
jgi:hypothetical protein